VENGSILKERKHMKAGVARVDITPPLNTPMMGYADLELKRRGETIRDPLNATALAFESGGKTCVIISLDVIIIDEADTAAVRAGIAAETGINPQAITCCATQTHSGPCTLSFMGWSKKNTDYTGGQMVPGAIKAGVEAIKAMQPARVGIATAQSQVGINRRETREDNNVGLGHQGWGPYDPEMTVLRVEGKNGTIANLVHYGAHPTVFNSSTRRISRDWPGVMCDRVESLTKAPTLFVNGAVGDVAPRVLNQSATGEGNGEMAVLEVGYRAATDAMGAWRSIKHFQEYPVELITGDTSFPYKPLEPLELAQKKVAEWEPQKHISGTPAAEYGYWSAVVEAHKKAPVKEKAFFQAITAVGPVAFVPSPGEPFTQIVMRIRKHSPFQHTLVCTTTNGGLAYFCTRESLHRGGYEVWVVRAAGPQIYAENVDDVIVQQNVALLRELHPKVYPAL
jgi:neutral ceramidase